MRLVSKLAAGGKMYRKEVVERWGFSIDLCGATVIDTTIENQH